MTHKKINSKVNQQQRAQMLLDLTAPRIVPQHLITIPVDTLTSDKNISYADKLIYGELYTIFNLTSKVQLNKQSLCKPFQISTGIVTRTINYLQKQKLIELLPVYDKNYHKKHGVIGYVIKNIGLNKSVASFNSSLQQSDLHVSKKYHKSEKKLNSATKTIIHYLNQKLHKHFHWQTYVNKVHARLKEHYTVHDFIVVINHKYLDWYYDSYMNRYLRPNTLFSKKFDQYLNETPAQNIKYYANISPKKAQAIAKKVIHYLNQKISSHFRWSVYWQLIDHRLSEHYNIKDFYTVIDHKYDDWHDDAKMQQNLQPQVLFSKRHFDQYLNEIPKSNNTVGNGNGDYIQSRKSDFNGIRI